MLDALTQGMDEGSGFCPGNGNEDDGLGVGQLDSLAASLLIVALGQVIGLLRSTLGLHVFVVVFSFLVEAHEGVMSMCLCKL